MTASHTTTDRSRSVTAACSPLDELNDITRETQSPAWDVPIQAAPALLRQRSPTAFKPPPKPRAPHPLAAQPLSPLPAGSTRRPLARCPSPSLSSDLFCHHHLSPVICPTTAPLPTR